MPASLEMAEDRAVIAVDIGNSSAKFGWFERRGVAPVPRPSRTLRRVMDPPDWPALKEWLGGIAPRDADWRIGNVNRRAATELIDWLRDQDAISAARLVVASDLPLTVALPRPDMVGVDRLLDAVAANALRPSDRAAVVIDLGTAITVDLVSADGAFQGGAILPGLTTSARALHQYTDMLPLVDELDEPPAPVGKATLEAMRSGLFWSAVGGIRELITRYAETLDSPPCVIVGGGGSRVVARLLGPDVLHEPDLALIGIALAARAEHAPHA